MVGNYFNYTFLDFFSSNCTLSKQNIKKEENYLWGIEKEKTEKEKFEEQMKNPDPNSEYQKFKKQKEEEEKNGK